MNLHFLQKYLPDGGLFFIVKWLKPYACTIKITHSRRSKLGDFRYRLNGPHQISINGDLEAQLFFFVLTHEIAHLISFAAKKKILPHGKEWKCCYRDLLLESLSIYQKDFQTLVKNFSKNPKASYNAASEIVRYFSPHVPEHFFIEDLHIGHFFEYQRQTFQILKIRKKRYICKNINSGKEYLFNTCVQVRKLTCNDRE
ncbi:transcription elongation protein SprT [Elizabethkingia argentiflava]|uniref:Transcription elongation protein SprT n=2 Tax=Elizabethkingia argenteiflava TaxID=2681556 RepID=A0A845PVL7_9FLAO|nr:transcription elongation protein SprT [Elizabethkingia argenteiflava]